VGQGRPACSRKLTRQGGGGNAPLPNRADARRLAGRGRALLGAPGAMRLGAEASGRSNSGVGFPGGRRQNGRDRPAILRPSGCVPRPFSRSSVIVENKGRAAGRRAVSVDYVKNAETDGRRSLLVTRNFRSRSIAQVRVAELWIPARSPVVAAARQRRC